MTWKEALIFLLIAGLIGGGAMWFSVWSCNKLHEVTDNKQLCDEIESPRDWTPCADGLSDDSNPYLVTIRPSNFRDYCDMCRHYNGEWHRADGHVYKNGVIAWQPLPAPYNPDHIRDTTKKVED